MAEVYLVAAAMTKFGRHPELSAQDLARQLLSDLLSDLGAEDAQCVESLIFGSAAHSLWGQRAIPGQIVLRPLFEEDILPRYLSITNVEGAAPPEPWLFTGPSEMSPAAMSMSPSP